jgi:polyisoprenoid-binding protein YceI
MNTDHDLATERTRMNTDLFRFCRTRRLFRGVHECMDGKLLTCRYLILATLCGAALFLPSDAAAGPIDVRHSKLTVFVYKAGLFSAFADNHVISAPIASGTITTAPSAAIELVVHAADLVPLDPDLDAAKREEVRTRMLSAEVLDTAKFPTIQFQSTTIESTGSDRWNVSGRLTIHGATRAVTFPVTRSGGRYRGETRIRQRDFGITPIRIAGGTVSVKDELKVEFEIAE